MLDYSPFFIFPDLLVSKSPGSVLHGGVCSIHDTRGTNDGYREGTPTQKELIN